MNTYQTGVIMKKFKMLFIAILLISVLTLSTMLCACDKDNGDTNTNDFELKFYDTKGYGYSIGNYATIIKSAKELTDFCNRDTSPIFKKEDEFTVKDNEKIIELFNEYDEDFFKNKSLVAIFRTRGCWGLKSEIKDYQIKDNSMNVTVSVISKRNVGYPTAITMHIFLLEFDKSKVSNVNQVIVEEIQEVVD